MWAFVDSALHFDADVFFGLHSCIMWMRGGCIHNGYATCHCAFCHVWSAMDGFIYLSICLVAELWCWVCLHGCVWLHCPVHLLTSCWHLPNHLRCNRAHTITIMWRCYTSCDRVSFGAIFTLPRSLCHSHVLLEEGTHMATWPQTHDPRSCDAAIRHVTWLFWRHICVVTPTPPLLLPCPYIRRNAYRFGPQTERKAALTGAVSKGKSYFWLATLAYHYVTSLFNWTFIPLI